MVWPWRRDRGSGLPLVGVTRSGPTGSRRADPAQMDVSQPTEEGARSPEVRGPFSDPDFVGGLRPISVDGDPGSEQRSGGHPAADIRGVSPSGQVVEVEIGAARRPVLLGFLTANCDGCEVFWKGLVGGAPPGSGLPPAVDAVVVTRGPGSVSPGEIDKLAGDGPRIPVIMSDEAWVDYRVLGYPFFVLVDPVTGTVVAETVGFGWDDLVSFVESRAG